MRPAGALVVLCALCSPARGSSRTDAASAESKNRRLKDEIEATERAVRELVQIAEAQGIPLDVQARGRDALRSRRLEDEVLTESHADAGAGAHAASAAEEEEGAHHAASATAEAEEEGAHHAASATAEAEAEGAHHAAGATAEAEEDGAHHAAADAEAEEGAHHGGEEEGAHHEGAAHHGGEEGEEHSEDSEQQEICNLDTSIMLLGMISFVMILFYLTNWPDDDIRLYSWQITSTTISIFCSVMLFQGFNKFLVKRVVHPFVGPTSESYPWIMTVFQFVQCFVYLACIHFGTGIASGVIGRRIWFNVDIDKKINTNIWVYTDALRHTNNSPVENDQLIRAVKRAKGKEVTETSSVYVNAENHEEIPVQKKAYTWLQRKRETKALGMLFAHLAGFAAIYSGKALQTLMIPEHLQGCDASVGIKFLGLMPVIINQVVLRLAFWVSGKLRDYQLKSLMTDSDNTDMEGLRKMQELMKEEVEESENDASSLSMSFLIVNNLVFFITDYLPAEESEHKVCSNGEEAHVDLEHGLAPVLVLYCTGFLMVGMAIAQAVAMAKYHHQLMNMGYNTLIRVLEAILNATGMCFAWCLIWATKWLDKMFAEMDMKDGESQSLFSHEILGRVLLAFMLTAVAALSVFAVDNTADAMRNNYSGDRDTLMFLEEITRVIVNSLGILVGFSWEHSFDGSVEDVAQWTSSPEWQPEFQLFLGLSVCILILPAWRDYILEKVMLIDVMLKQKRGLGPIEGDEHAKAHEAK